jgi:hypothetical protein
MSRFTTTLPDPTTLPDLKLRPTGLIESWTRFWFNAGDPFALHVVRFLAGLLFLSWLLPLVGYQGDFFGLQGFYDLQAFKDTAREARRPGQPIQVPVTWSLLYVTAKFPALLNVIYWSTISVLVLFTLGIATRITAVLTWVLLASFINNPVLMYDADHLLLLLAFYLMVGYLLEGLWNRPLTLSSVALGSSDGLAWRLFTPSSRRSVGANLALRLIQVHFTIVIVTSALHKFQFGDWWSGLAFWYPLHPPLETTKNALLLEKAFAQDHFIWLSLTQYLMLAWRRAWRPVLLVGALLGWIGCLQIYGMPLFGGLLMIVSLAFVEEDEWHALGQLINRLLGKNYMTEAGIVGARN